MNNPYGYDGYNGYNGYMPTQNAYWNGQRMPQNTAAPASSLQQNNQPMTLYDVIGKGTRVDWVQGELAAKSYLVPPGMTVLLFDMETPNRVYAKAVNMSGVPIFTSAFDLGEVEMRRSMVPDDDRYVTREEHDRSMKKIVDLLARMTGGKEMTEDDAEQTARMGHAEPERSAESAEHNRTITGDSSVP